MRRLATWLLTGVGSLLLLVLALYIGLCLINWRDEPPSAAIARLEQLSADRAAVADEDNAYLFVMGFDVVQGEDPVAWGATRVAYMRETARGRETTTPTVPRISQSEFAAGVPDVAERCKSIGQACLVALESAESAHSRGVTNEHWLIGRYRTLLAYSGWSETALGIDAEFPPYHRILDAQRLYLMEVWHLAGDRVGADQVLASLDRDLRFWRRVSAESDTLITRMVAATAIKRHFEWGNLALARLSALARASIAPASWREPFSRDEQSMQRVLVGEWMFGESVLQTMDLAAWDGDDQPGFQDRLIGLLARPLFKEQDLRNRRAELLVSLIDTLAVPLSDFPQASVRAAELEEAARAEAFASPLFNPVGDRLVAAEADFTQYSAYAVRTTDLEGFRRLAVQAVSLHREGIPAAGVPAALRSAELRSPYDDEPFQWDAETRTLTFAGLTRGERGEYRLLYSLAGSPEPDHHEDDQYRRHPGADDH